MTRADGTAGPMSKSAESRMTEAVEDAALAWLVRISAPHARAEDWAELTAWLEADPAHLEAFEHLEALDAEIDAAAPELKEALSRAVVVPIRPLRAVQGVGLAAAAAALILALPIAWKSLEGSPTIYETARGQTREVVLSDGTRVRLNASSQMTVRLGLLRRQVRLEQAEAAFDVAHDRIRPFDIVVGDQQVRVVGTAFNIRHYGSDIQVTVQRGVVEILQPSLGPRPLARLTQGQALRHTVGTSRSLQFQEDPDVALGWTLGRLVCADRPLGDIVEDLNRRYTTQIVLSDEAANKRFSGVLDLEDDQAAVVRRLAHYLGLPVNRAGDKIILG